MAPGYLPLNFSSKKIWAEAFILCEDFCGEISGDIFQKISSDLFREFGYLNGTCIRRILFLCFRVSREINSRFCSKTQRQMRMLVSCRLVGAHRDGHHHGVSIQISVNLGKKSIPISCLPESWDSLCKFNFFLLPDSELYLVNGFDFYILISFEWRDTENQQYVLFFQFRKAGIQLLSSGPSFNQC